MFFRHIIVFLVRKVAGILDTLAEVGGCAGIPGRPGRTPKGQLVLQFLETFLELQRQRQAVVHIRGLLETTSTLEPVGVALMGRAGDETDTCMRHQ